MLTAERLSDTVKTLAADAEAAQAPFVCPGCRKVVTLRKGRIRVHHFAHKPPVTCARGAGESVEHLQAKLEIFRALQSEPNVTDLELERDVGTNIADVFARINGVPVAIEIQRSQLTPAAIARRTERYHELGIAVLWLGLQKPQLSETRYRPAAWEKWCHAAYFGRVYFWEKGQCLVPVHFGDYHLDVPTSEWFEHGEHRSAGGYSKKSAAYRTPMRGLPVLLSSMFRPNKRTRLDSKTISVPACTLYIDRQSAWWK